MPAVEEKPFDLYGDVLSSGTTMRPIHRPTHIAVAMPRFAVLVWLQTLHLSTAATLLITVRS